MSSNAVSLTESYVPAANEVPIVHKTVGQFLREVTAAAPDRLALVDPASPARATERRWTYRQLLAESERTAAALLHCFKRGDHVAVWAPNQVEYVMLQMGAALAGVVLVTLNPANRKEEMRYLLGQSESVGLIMNRVYRNMDNVAVIDELRPELPALKQVIYFEEWDKFIAQGRVDAPLPDIGVDDPVLILYTSGTTGKPKGVVHKHQSLVGNARASSARYGLGEGSVWLATLPMFHIGGSVTMTLGCIANRGTQVMLPEFKPDYMMELVEKYKANITMVVPTMLFAMTEHETFGKYDLSSLKFVLTGGTIITPEVIRALRETLKVDAGLIFGQTEAGGVMAQSYRGEPEERLCNTVGRALSGCEMKVAHIETNQPVPIGEIGEFCVRSPYMMKQYFQMPEVTAKTIDAEGWLHTGDLGVMRPDGYVQITGRLKDMIIRGGENIYPREVEDVLSGHPDLADAAVFGIPDEKWGEQVAAAVRVKAASSAKDEDFAAFLDGKIARHKIPKFWMRVDAFPTNASGKVQKFVLRDMWVAQHGKS